jgi:glycosyltransferase involved in cell wall biosynthesis/LmbE family N-acetylglucosaminyl deacetylase
MNVVIKSILRRFVRVARPHLRFAGLLQTAGIFDRSAVVWSPGAERVLVLAPHMDDETIGCGGTLALHAQQGARICVVFLTDGRNGGGGIGALDGEARRLKQIELVAIRKREAAGALAALGISDMRCLEMCDGRLMADADAAAVQLRAILDEVQPTLVYLPMFIEEHTDHRAASSVLLKALEHSPLDFLCAGYEVWTALFPNSLVNISSTLSKKREALSQYRSQLEDGDYLHACIGLNAYRSIALHKGQGSFAEAFFMCPLHTYRRAYAEFMTATQREPKVALATAPGRPIVGAGMHNRHAQSGMLNLNSSAPLVAKSDPRELEAPSRQSIASVTPPRPSSSRPLRIGIMLRHWEQHGGVTVYAQQLTRALAELSSQHTFVLIYRNPQLIGTCAGPNVEEIALPAGSILWWDQVRVPRAVREHRIDVLFNPKYSVPLSVDCPTAWVCHGLDWYVMPEASPWLDRLSHRFLVPRYANKADAVIAVSEVTGRHLQHYLNLPRDRIHTIYPGIAPAFSKEIHQEELDSVRKQLNLPPKYVVYSGAIYPPKNFTRLVRAYARVGPALGVSLVIAGGENRYLSAHELQEPERLNLGDWVRRLGWVDNAILPAVYAMASALLLPSLFESVGLPILEAMAIGCPVLTSNRHGTKEISGNAAALVDPESEDDIASGLQGLLENEEYRAQLSAAGRKHAEQFRWDSAAREVLNVLERIAAQRRK